MEYHIEYGTIMSVVEEEISREAAQAVTAEGVSLYDEVRMVSRDEEKMRRLMSEVIATIRLQCNRFVCHVDLEETYDEPLSFCFNLNLSPRRAAGKSESFATLFRSVTVNLILNKYFASKNLSDLASKYDALALSDIKSINRLLYEKLPPCYPEIV